MTDSENRDDEGGGRTNRPAPRDPRPLFRDELQEPAPDPENPTVLLPAPPVQRRTPAPDATKVMPVQAQPPRSDRPFPPVQRQGGNPPVVVPPAAPTIASARSVPPGATPPAGGSGGRPQTGRPPKPPRARRPRRWARRLAITLAVLILVPVGLYFFADTKVDRVNAFPAASTRPPATPGQDWLIVGSDSRAGLSKSERKKLATGRATGKRTDTMMLLHIPDSDVKPTLVSLPRDSYLPIPGHGSNRLNAAFAFGGAKLLVQTVEDATDIRIDHYAEVGMGGVFDVVNALGGVEMCVKTAMKDPKAGLDISEGCQNLDGAEALGFSRSRASTRGDLDRVDHQRDLMTALIEKVASPSTLVNPLKLWPLVNKGSASLTIDGSDHLLDLARLAFAAKSLGTTTTVPIGGTPTIGGAEVLTWDKARADAMFDALRTDRKVPKTALGG